MKLPLVVNMKNIYINMKKYIAEKKHKNISVPIKE